MKKTIGILAHVDAGKTTLSEQMLYHAGAISSCGRVDHKDTFLDNNEIEQKRGITIFSGLAHFSWNGNDYCLIDTPGHIDFAGETERAVSVLDYAILVINAAAGMEAHSLSLFQLLKKHRIPVFFFLNKTDLVQADIPRCLQDIREKCTDRILYISSPSLLEHPENDFKEAAAELDDALLELFLEDALSDKALFNGLIRCVNDGTIVPCISGSALNDQGVLDFMAVFDALTTTSYEKQEEEPFLAKAYQIRHDKNGERLTFLKILSGRLHVKDRIRYEKNSPFLFSDQNTKILPTRGTRPGAVSSDLAASGSLLSGLASSDSALSGSASSGLALSGSASSGSASSGLALSGSASSGSASSGLASSGEDGTEEKINQIRCYHGASFTSAQNASAGDMIAVTGISGLQPVNLSELEFRPALQSKIIVKNCDDTRLILKNLKQLEAEDPLLHVSFDTALQEIHLEIMGKIQLEVLKQYLLERFSMEAEFEPPEILYKETIASPVRGCGHFEPLRHYAEAHLLLEPAKRGSGISFESTCHVDMLSLNYQHLIRTHVFEKEHKGILTGSPLTDVKITLTKGRSHIKHTEGGDFREAVFRAIRQGLEHAENVLLEPYYAIEIDTNTSYMGRILSDIQKLNGTIKPPEQTGATLHISAYGPVACFLDYPAELISFTKGSAAISMKICGYDICHNPEDVIERKGYQKDADLDNVSCSVFCHKGESFLVPWDKAEQYMHC